MYFPYLRGKQEEILAIRELEFSTKRTVPIFEPTNFTKVNRGRWKQSIEAGRRIAIVVNSANGTPIPSTDEVCNFVENLPYESVFPALEIRPNTSDGEVEDFSEKFKGRTCLVVHRNHLYTASELKKLLRPLSDDIVHVHVERGVSLDVSSGLQGQGLVLLRDGFEYESRNADYPARTHFDDTLFKFEGLNFDGFGDYTIVGDRFSAGGGAARAVALHLTEVGPTAVVCHHFVSEGPHVKGDLAGKYFSALERLIAYVDSQPQFETYGVGRFLDSFANGRFPGLGQPKRWSMLHHFEIIEKNLCARGTPTFV